RRAAARPPAPACPRGLRSLPLWPELLRPARPPRPGVEDDASARDGRGAGLAGERPGAPPRDRAAAALQRALRDRAAGRSGDAPALPPRPVGDPAARRLHG